MCGRGFYGCVNINDVLMEYIDGTFLGWVNGCELRSSDGFSWKILNGP